MLDGAGRTVISPSFEKRMRIQSLVPPGCSLHLLAIAVSVISTPWAAEGTRHRHITVEHQPLATGTSHNLKGRKKNTDFTYSSVIRTFAKGPLTNK